MKTTVNFHHFAQAFHDMGRQENFTIEGLRIIFDYLEDYEELELDVIAICCDFSQDSWEDIAENYSIDLTDCGDDDKRAEAVYDFLDRHSQVIGEVEGGFIYRNF